MAVVINGTSGITGNTGTLISATTIGVGGATPSASGAGITFPATQSASTNANTLDDYEEGTFTPTIDGSSSSPTVTYTTQNGTYTKVGNVVSAYFYIEGSARTGGTGDLVIRGLPFACATSKTMGGNIITYQVSWGATGCLYPTFTSDGSTAFYVLGSANNGSGWTRVGITSVTNATWAMYLCVVYSTST